ncbi:MAG TPA: hypothetical protein EYG69_02255 [Campylobacterales bacterium]|nr:hypothetical protein [Campylobacterales bacterium]
MKDGCVTEEFGIPSVRSDDKVVNQLDEVTRDSEIKASEIFDRLEEILNHISNIQNITSQLEKKIENSNLEDKEEYNTLLSELHATTLDSSDEVMNIMDTMQYQDIHRQKIERVINVIRGLARYMNSLFDSDIHDDDRVSSAQYIPGDKDDENVMDNNDIEKILASFTATK